MIKGLTLIVRRAGLLRRWEWVLINRNNKVVGKSFLRFSNKFDCYLNIASHESMRLASRKVRGK